MHQRRRHDLPLRPRMPWAITDQLRAPCLAMSCRSSASSCGSQQSETTRAAVGLRQRLPLRAGKGRSARAGPKGAHRPTADSGRCREPCGAARPARRARPRATRARARTSGDHGPAARRGQGEHETERSATRARRVRRRQRVSADAATRAYWRRSRVAAAAAGRGARVGPARRFDERGQSCWRARARRLRPGECAPLMNAPGGVILRAAVTRTPPVLVEAVVPESLSLEAETALARLRSAGLAGGRAGDGDGSCRLGGRERGSAGPRGARARPIPSNRRYFALLRVHLRCTNRPPVRPR